MFSSSVLHEREVGERVDRERLHSSTSLPLRLTLRCFLRILRPYWLSREGLAGWGMLATIVALNASFIYLNTLLNTWQRDFWDSIERYEMDRFFPFLLQFSLIALFWVLSNVYNTYINSRLCIRWRRWLTEHVLEDWMRGSAYYKMQLLDAHTDNPDQRIAQDLNEYVVGTLSLFLSTLSDIANLITFSVVLWGLSHSVTLELWGQQVTLPDGYLLYISLCYSCLGTIATFLIGRPLVRLTFRQERYEANFRYALVRVRENSESIALYNGEAQEDRNLGESFSEILSNLMRLIYCRMRLALLTRTYLRVGGVFPILIAAPMYFAKIITMGTIMQISNAFSHVQGALSTLVTSFTAWAAWKATVDRLALYFDAIDEAQGLKCAIPAREGQGVRLSGLEVRTPSGDKLIKGLSLELSPGERLLIRGPSGCGKTTLLRAVAGLWPYASGQVSFPGEGEVMFLSQRPYLPLGSLRAAACYPHPEDHSERVGEFLAQLGLARLIPDLDRSDNWSQMLSLGEQQRVALVRALLARPALLFLDEASSALDEETEDLAYSLLESALPSTIIVSVGHRPGLDRHHNVALQGDGLGNWSVVARQGGSHV
ncbi:MAG: ABC transporter ATP-binding protein/permease [Succinivibrionaceae bacterium]|nr:ABC transporter ATP-binding protein/permease [Succinivibrionaceae bacterium]